MAKETEKPENPEKEAKPAETPTSGETEELLSSVSKPTETGDEPQKRRGRPKGSKNRTGKGRKSASQKYAEYYASAQFTNQVALQAFSLIGGEEALPTQEENEQLNHALAAVYEKREVKASPEVVAAALYSTFVLNKMAKPSVAERFKIAGATIWIKTTGLIGRAKNRVVNAWKNRKENKS